MQVNKKLEQYIKYVSDKNVLIFGLGLQGGGVGATKFFAKYAKNVKITDLKTKKQLQSSLDQLQGLSLTFTLGEHDNKDIHWADIVLVNQDVWNKAPNSPYIQLAKELDKDIETEIGLFFKLTQTKIIGVTGTRGKTTTTMALYHLLNNCNLKVMVGGNIPNQSILFRIEETFGLDYVILELSNYQLRGLHLIKKSPHIAIITSIYPDHLLSYPSGSLQDSMSLYIQDKTAIYRYQTENDYLIIKNQQDYFDKFEHESRAEVIRFSKDTLPKDWRLKLSGVHNRENLGSVYHVGKILNINEQLIRKFITSFSGVDHRLQLVKIINNVKFINDTTSTTPVASEIALNTFSKNNIAWIAGGNTKNLPIDNLVKTAKNLANFIFLLPGNATDKLKTRLLESGFNKNNIFGPYDNFTSCIEDAFSSLKSNGVVLLSPGFTSFGSWNNEFERGDEFCKIVAEL